MRRAAKPIDWPIGLRKSVEVETLYRVNPCKGAAADEPVAV